MGQLNFLVAAADALAEAVEADAGVATVADGLRALDGWEAAIYG